VNTGRNAEEVGRGSLWGAKFPGEAYTFLCFQERERSQMLCGEEKSPDGGGEEGRGFFIDRESA